MTHQARFLGMKKVSVIIHCYNQSKFVQEAIESVIKQTYSNIEIVCINDGSTDNSSRTIQKLAQKYKQIIFFDEKENHGVIYARNTAISAATGEYILPLDADDTIEPEYIEEAVKVLDNSPDTGIVYSKARLLGAQNKELKLPDYSKSNILSTNCIFVSALFRKADFISIGGYKEYMKDGYEDWDLWLSFIEKGFNVHKIDKILFSYRKHDKNSRSSQITKTQMEKIYKTILKHHTSLYLEDSSIIQKLFSSSDKKLQKYKRICLFFSWVIIIESLIILYVLFVK